MNIEAIKHALQRGVDFIHQLSVIAPIPGLGIAAKVIDIATGIGDFATHTVKQVEEGIVVANESDLAEIKEKAAAIQEANNALAAQIEAS